MEKNIYLTSEETLALNMLSLEKSYSAIKRECNLSSAQMPVFMASLRRKTGIRDLRDAEQVKSYSEAYDKASGISPEQKQAMCRVLGIGFNAQHLDSIGYTMGIERSAALALWHDGLKAAGIFTPDARMQRVQARIYMAVRHPLNTGNRLTPEHEMIVDLLRAGRNKFVIASELGRTVEYVHQAVRDIALRLGVTARGRGIQEKLCIIAADRQKADEIDMNDPAF